jgi:beta-galactosidase
MGDSAYSCKTTKNSKGNVGGIRKIPAAIALPADGGPQSLGFDDSKWRMVDVPHDFVVEQIPEYSLEGSHGYRAKNVSWYRREINIIASGSEAVWLEFDGVYRAADFWMNGQYLGHHSSGYTSFRFRLDTVSFVKMGASNLLAVRVDPRANEGWFYEGGGIYRHVWLVTTPAAHIAPWGVYAPSQITGTIGRTGGYAQADATVTIITELEGLASRTNVDNGQIDGRFAVQTAIVGPDGQTTVWTGSVPAAAATGASSVTQQANLSNAALWEPPPPNVPPNVPPSVRTAALYTVVSTLMQDSKAIDSVNTTIGIRHLDFDPNKGLVVNGVAVKAKGMCNHQVKERGY